MAEFPTAGVELTHILVVDNLARSRTFYRDVRIYFPSCHDQQAAGTSPMADHPPSAAVRRFW